MTTLNTILKHPVSDIESIVRFDLIHRGTGFDQTLAYSLHGYVTPSDEGYAGFFGPNFMFPARIKSSHDFSASLMEPRITGVGPSSFGPIELLNHDDALSDLITDYVWDGRPMTTLIGLRNERLLEFVETSSRTIAGSPRMSTAGTILINSQDWRSRTVSSQQNKFEGFGSCARIGTDAAGSFDMYANLLYNLVDFSLWGTTVEFRVRTYGTKNAGSTRHVLGKGLSWLFSVNSTAQLMLRMYHPTDGNYYLWRWASGSIDMTSYDWKSISCSLPVGFDMTADDPVLSIDGVVLGVQSTSSAVGVYDADAHKLQLGGDQIGGSVEGEFDIDELRIWTLNRDQAGILDTYDRPISSSNKLQGYWRFDENSSDEAYHQFHNPESITTVTYAVGQEHRDLRRTLDANLQRRDINGYNFDGTDDRVVVTLGSTSKFDLATAGEFTLDCTFVLQALPSVRAEAATLFIKDAAYRLIINTSDQLMVSVWDSGAWVNQSFSTFTPLIGQQYTVLVDFVDSTDVCRLWIPNWSTVIPYETKTMAGTPALIDSTNDLVLGAEDATTNRLHGWLGCCRVWDTASVSLEDNLGSWAFYVSADSTQYTSLIGEYRMHQGTGTTVTDSAASAKDGTWNGSASVPFNHAIFLKDIDASWTGTATGDSVLRGEDKPQVEGPVFSFEPVLVYGTDDDVYQIYMVNYRGMERIDNLYIDAIPKTFDADTTDIMAAIPAAGEYATDLTNGFVSIPTTDGVVTVDVAGDNAGSYGFTSTAFEILRKIADEQGSLDVTGLTWTQDERINRASWFSRFSAPKVTTVLDTLARSISAYWLLNRSNEVRVGLIDSPSTWTPDYVLDDEDILSIEALQPLTVSFMEQVRWGRLGRTLRDSNVSGTLDANEKFNLGRDWKSAFARSRDIETTEPGSEQFITSTALTYEWSGDAEAERRKDLYSHIRHRIKVVIGWTPRVGSSPLAGAKSLWFVALPGEIVKIVSSRLGHNPFGKNYIIAKIRENLTSKTIELELWGGVDASADINLLVDNAPATIPEPTGITLT